MESALFWDIIKLAFVLAMIKLFAPNLFQSFNDFYDALKKAFK